MASSSTAGSNRTNEIMGAFDGIAPSASPSASKLMKKPSYDVFINHRGPDVKYTIAGVLYGILTGMALSVFLDSQELEYGDFLPRTIEAAMTSALLHIAIFSERYAESPWCLAELSFMLKSGATIIPIFYHVEPTDLRYIDQGKGIYVDAFKKHEQKGRYSVEQLQEWKKALYNVSFYNGQIIKTNEDEMRLLKNIVNCVFKTINNVPLVVAKHPVGMKEIVHDFEVNTIQSAKGDPVVQIVGIWGMGGSGKTTLAKELYNNISSLMERSSFVFNVRDAAARGVLLNKQIKLINDLGGQGVAFDNIEEGMGILSRYLRSVRVLIVLDDVDHVEQLDALLPVKDSLERGSRIIVTTREYDVLKSWGISSIYKMRALDPFQAEQLFCWHAFIQPFPRDGFEDLVKKFLGACHGLPLSLKVFGGQLYGESHKECWESLLHKIARILPNDIKEKLKVSYDALDYEEKEMFLDTACFFLGEENSLAIEVWNGSGWSGLHSWERLLNKCLVELDNNNCIRMHDHLRDLGREIANQHSPSRLWLPLQIINAEKQTEKRNDIRGIRAVSTGIQEWSYEDEEELVDNVSGGILLLAPSLVGLKVFVIRGDYFNQVMGEISRELVWLRWFQIGQRNLPAQLSMKNLRVLELCEDPWEHQIEELWEAESKAPLQLRVLVIFNSQNFQRFPNSIGCLKELKKIVITTGHNLRSLPEEFCRLQSLEHLQLCECAKLLSLPSRFGDLKNLRYLQSSRCINLKRLPVSFKNLMLLQYLNLEECGQLKLTSGDFQNIKKLEFLSLSWCEQVEELPSHITNQVRLKELYLDGVTYLWELPVNIGKLSRLLKMSIGSGLLTSLPNSIGDLSSLTDLSIGFFPDLESLPPSLANFSLNTGLSKWSCPNLESLPTSLGDLLSLTHLSIATCPNLESLPTSLGDLSSLTHLRIIHCPKLKCLPFSVGRLNLLQSLQIGWCPISHVDFGAAPLPFALSNLKRIFLKETAVSRISIFEDRYPRLESLSLYNNHHLTEIEALPTTVKSIRLEHCEMLKIVRVIGDPVNLESLSIKSCPELDELPSLARSTSLRYLSLRGCDQIEKIEGLKYCTRLEILLVDTCWEVPGIESLEHMEKLRELQLRANKGSAIQHCIQTIQKWPNRITISTRALPDASSLVDSLLSPNLVVGDSISNQKIKSSPKLVQNCSSNGDAIMLCFVINCVSSQMNLCLETNVRRCTLTKVDKGRWAWIGVFTQRSSYFERIDSEEFSIDGNGGECEEEDEVEKGLVVRGEEQTLEEAVRSFLSLLQS